MMTRTIRTSLLSLTLPVFFVVPSLAQEGGAATGASEGIEVHGHWIIEVYEGDDLVTQREFNNALTADGANLLADLVHGVFVAGVRWIQIREDLCDTSTGDPVYCLITEPEQPSGSFQFNNLEVVSNSGAVTLSGSFQAANDGSIQSVHTHIGRCGRLTTINDCSPSFLDNQTGDLTSKDITPNIEVVAGQTVNVTVTISFESG